MNLEALEKQKQTIPKIKRTKKTTKIKAEMRHINESELDRKTNKTDKPLAKPKQKETN